MIPDLLAQRIDTVDCLCCNEQPNDKGMTTVTQEYPDSASISHMAFSPHLGHYDFFFPYWPEGYMCLMI